MPTVSYTNHSFKFDKLVNREGSGKYFPNDFSTCLVLIQCSAEVVTRTIGYEVGRPTTIIIGNSCSHVACIVDLCLQTMTIGEQCTATFQFDDINAQEYSSLDLELISFEPASGIHVISSSEKMARAVKLKEIGTTAFRSGDIRTSFYKFSRSLKYVSCAAYDPVFPENQADVDQHLISDNLPTNTEQNKIESASATKDERDRLACQCWLNIAACQLRFENFEMAKLNCSRALAVNKDNVKGLFRRAQCSLKLQDEHGALSDLEHALTLEPDNREITKLLQTAKFLCHQSNEKLASAMSKMFK